MIAYFRAFVRSLFVAAVLVCAAQTADADRPTTHHTTEPTKPAEVKPAPADSDDLPLEGLLIIAGVVVVVVFVAWVASRVGDNKSHVIG